MAAMAGSGHAGTMDGQAGKINGHAGKMNGHASEKQVVMEDDTELIALRRGLKLSPKQIPCSFLYDERGSALYNQITELEEYYPYKTEIKMLQQHASDLIKQIPKGARIVELGCGSATKTSVLLRELLHRDDHSAFIGIDVSADFLDEAKENLLSACQGLLPENVEMIQAPYLDGLREARKRHPGDVLCVLWLGSSIGNLDHHDSQAFFEDIMKISGSKTQVLVCTDLWKDSTVLHKAYCDSQGVTEQFIKNGLRNALSAVSRGATRIDLEDWEYDVVVNPDSRQVEMYVIARQGLCVNGYVSIQKGERLLMEVSRKFLPDQLRQLAYQSGFIFQAQWKNQLYSIQMLSAPEVAFQTMWGVTDQLFKLVHNWSAIPISLRHPFLFYYGHLPAFAKIKLFQEMPQSKLDIMFSRGIDPDVCDPSRCHSHPEVPSCWPSKSEVMEFAHEARNLVKQYLQKPNVDMWLINMVLEHECMHQETLCYMLAQQQKQSWEEAHLNSSGNMTHQNGLLFKESLARWSLDTDLCQAEDADEWTNVPGGKVTLGVPGNRNAGPYIWDNEGPPQNPQLVSEFRISNRPVSVAEFRDFVLAGGYQKRELWTTEGFECVASRLKAPATWTLTADNDIWIHLPEGTFHWEQVQDRPVWCCLVEAQAYCKSKGCSILTEEEYLRALDVDPTGKRIKSLECNGWELTSTCMEPLQGFTPMSDYPEYSAEFYDGKHFVLRGASPYTPPAVVRGSFRNFYQDVYPYHFAKFRCCTHTK